MKITSAQKNALANKIYDEFKKQGDELKKSEEYINFENTLRTDNVYKTLKKIKELTEGLSGQRSEINYYSSLTNAVQDYVNVKRNKAFPSTLYSGIPSMNSIELEITLKTIECDNLQELIDSVKESLK